MMINIRKIVFLSALLMSASSFITPTYAMLDDEQGASASRITHAQVPLQLTPDMLSEIKQYGSFLAEGREYVLQNPEKLESFAKYLSPKRRQDSFQRSIAGENLLNYEYLVQTYAPCRNPNYDPTRPVETGPEWINRGGCFVYSLCFKQNPAPAKPLAVVPKIEEQEIGSGAAASSVPAPMSSDSSSKDAAQA